MALLSEGQSIRDTYEVERYLGEGAFAEVYRVKHRFLGRQAMKVFKTSGMTLPDIEGMLDEAILLSKIGHPNIVRVFDANTLETESGLYGYFTMENVAGGSLDKFWRSHGNRLIPPQTTVNIIQQVCRGLALAHNESPPIIHRDIKPQNILVGYEADGLRARISDFGLAKRVNPLTLLATAAGTLGFKPPEVFSDQKTDSCAADVWAVGTTLYLLLTGLLPFKFPQDLGWGNHDFFKTSIRQASELNADVDSTLDAIVGRCLSIQPEDRYASAAELLKDLEAWSPHQTIALSNAPAAQDSGYAPVQADLSAGKRLADAALERKKQNRLSEAADLMEEAFNLWPELRENYAHQVRLWRCGISM